jgi:hypothetical protein
MLQRPADSRLHPEDIMSTPVCTTECKIESLDIANQGVQHVLSTTHDLVTAMLLKHAAALIERAYARQRAFLALEKEMKNGTH